MSPEPNDVSGNVINERKFVLKRELKIGRVEACEFRPCSKVRW